jgi:hypothetical protein
MQCSVPVGTRIYYNALFNILIEKLPMEVASEHIIHEPILRLIVHAPRLILENHIVVPAPFHNEVLWIQERVPSG